MGRGDRREPVTDTQSGRAILEEFPDTPGSLGIAISEAVEDAAQRDDTSYSLGSVLNHVLLHQTVIGQEAIAQMELAGAFPDVVIGCVGGGSNFAGLAFPFIREKIAGRDIDVLACEPAACPTLTRGLFAYDFGDTSKLTPLVPMHTLGHDFVPAPIHAGGLRYHGVAPLISQLVQDGLIRAEAYLQSDVFASAIRFANSEGIIPGARVLARDPRRARGRPAGRRGGRAADDSLQPLRPRPFRHGRVRQLPRREARGRRARRGRDRARAASDRGAADARVKAPRAPAYTGSAERGRLPIASAIRAVGQESAVLNKEIFMAVGPVDVYIIGFPGNKFTGQIAPAILDLVENGTIRVLDLLFVMKGADGVVTTVAAADIDEEGAAYLSIDVTQPGALGPEDAEEVGDDLPADSSALLIAFENLWAGKVVDALQAADAVLIDSIRIPVDVVEAFEAS